MKQSEIIMERMRQISAAIAKQEALSRDPNAVLNQEGVAALAAMVSLPDYDDILRILTALRARLVNEHKAYELARRAEGIEAAAPFAEKYDQAVTHVIGKMRGLLEDLSALEEERLQLQEVLATNGASPIDIPIFTCHLTYKHMEATVNAWRRAHGELKDEMISGRLWIDRATGATSVVSAADYAKLTEAVKSGIVATIGDWLKKVAPLSGMPSTPVKG